MMRNMRFGLLAAMAISMVAVGQAQVTPKGNRSDEILVKIHEADLLVQLTPIAMTKDQMNKIMLALEKIRAQQAKIRAQEDEILAQLEPSVEKAVTGAIEKQEYPPRAMQELVSKATRNMSINRVLAFEKMVQDLTKAIKKELNAGQIKAMTHSLLPEALDPSKRSKDMSDEDKLQFFIGRIFMDDTTYGLLGRMSKFASN